MRWTKLLRQSSGFHAALGFAALLVLGFLIGALIGTNPSHQAQCDSDCAKVGMLGQLTPKYSPIQTKRSPLECKCVRYRTQ